MEWLLAGLGFGFLGSMHCVGMCGPLALALPGKRAARWRYLTERMLYNLGRAVTYVLLGAAVGILGRLVALGGYQQAISIFVGGLMILAATVPWVQRRFQTLEQWTSQWMGKVVQSIQALYRRGGAGAMLGIGLLNGILPCGFVYAGLGTALTAGSVGTSMLFMGGFGLGTIPAMFAMSTAGRWLPTRWRRRLTRLVPLGLILVGFLLIWRGLDLGLFLSPDLS